MAINPKVKYPGQLDETDPTGYPYGKARNRAFEGDPTGTPYERDLVNDVLGFQQALLADAVLTPSGTPDSATASQYLQAVKEIFDRRLAVAQWKNLIYKIPVGTVTTTSIYEPTRKLFMSFGFTTPNLSGISSRNGRIWLTITGIPAGVGLTPHRKSADHDGAGIILVGGTPGSSSTSKFRRSADGGLNWTAEDSALNDTAGVQTLRWIPYLNLWVAGHTGGNVETSPDGEAWTQQTAPNALARSEIATNGSIVVMGNTAQADVITSPDGLNWTNRNLGAGTSSRALAYSSKQGKFFAVDQAGSTTLSSSADGITWSQAGLTVPAGSGTAQSLVEYNGGIILVTLVDTYPTAWYSDDGCQTWEFLNTLDDATTFKTMSISSDTAQMLMVGATENHYTSLAGR